MEVKSNNILIKLQVFAVFQKMGMSLSHRGALNLIDRIGEKHDQRITERRDQIQEQMANDNVYIHVIILTRWTCANCTTATSIAWRTF